MKFTATLTVDVDLNGVDAEVLSPPWRPASGSCLVRVLLLVVWTPK